MTWTNFIASLLFEECSFASRLFNAVGHRAAPRRAHVARCHNNHVKTQSSSSSISSIDKGGVASVCLRTRAQQSSKE